MPLEAQTRAVPQHTEGAALPRRGPLCVFGGSGDDASHLHLTIALPLLHHSIALALIRAEGPHVR